MGGRKCITTYLLNEICEERETDFSILSLSLSLLLFLLSPHEWKKFQKNHLHKNDNCFGVGIDLCNISKLFWWKGKEIEENYVSLQTCDVRDQRLLFVRTIADCFSVFYLIGNQQFLYSLHYWYLILLNLYVIIKSSILWNGNWK